MERGWFRAYVLYVDDEPCAFWMGFGYRGVFRTGLTGYDPAYAEYHVGTFVLMRMLDDLAREDGFHTVDYGFGDAEYKRTFGTDSWQEADVFVFARTARGIWLNLARTSIAGLDRASRSVAGSLGKRDEEAVASPSRGRGPGRRVRTLRLDPQGASPRRSCSCRRSRRERGARRALADVHGVDGRSRRRVRRSGASSRTSPRIRSGTRT